MNKKNMMMVSAAAAVLLTAGMASPALAATSDAAQQAEIDALKQQIQILNDRLNAQEARQAAVEAQASQATATAEAAQVKAAQVDTIPAQVKTAVADNTPKPTKSWADDTKISGRMYYNISHIEQESNGNKVAPTGTGFDIKRFYVGIDHKFNDAYSANITTDMNYVSNDGETQVYLKKAYLQAKFSDALTLRLGSADLPWVPFAEDAYGYRFIENEVVDRVKFGTSADWGVHASGKVGMVSYAAAVINGNGYKNPTRSGSVDFEGRVSTNIQNVILGAGIYSGKLGKAVEGVTTYHTATRWNALAAYKTDTFRIGAEYFIADNWTRVTSTTGDKADGWSVFGSYNFMPNMSAFARYDSVNPSKDINSALDDQYYNIGVSWTPVKIVDFALVYKHDAVDGGTLGTSNGTIGGSTDGTYDEIGLFGQLRW
ncbi:MAG TPA: porin [Caulobacteraceae bacterium]